MIIIYLVAAVSAGAAIGMALRKPVSSSADGTSEKISDILSV